MPPSPTRPSASPPPASPPSAKVPPASPPPASRYGTVPQLPPFPRPATGRPPVRRGGRRRPPKKGFSRTLHIYLAGEVLQVFAVALGSILLVYTTVVAFQLVREGIRLGFVWPHILKTLAYPLFFSIPLGLLMGITLGLGRLANDHELSALRAQGLSHRQIAQPIAWVAVILGGLTFYLSGWVLPEVHYEQSNLRETILNQLHRLGSGAKRTILMPGNVSLWVMRYDGQRLEGIILKVQGHRTDILPRLGEAAGGAVRQRLAGGVPAEVRLVAREAVIETVPEENRVLLRLSGVDIHVPEEVKGPRGKDTFYQTYSFDRLPLPLSFSRRGESPKDMTNPELIRWIGEVDRDRRQIKGAIAQAEALTGASSPDPEDVEDLRRESVSLQRKAWRAESELHSRFAFSLACLTFPLVALPLVVLLERRGRLIHFFLGNLTVITFFFPLLMAGHLLASRGWPAALALQLPNIALAGLGSALAWKMAAR